MFRNGAHSQLDDILRLTRAFITGTHGLLAQFVLLLRHVFGTFTTILVGGFLVKLDHFPIWRLENKTWLIQHRLVFYWFSIGIPKNHMKNQRFCACPNDRSWWPACLKRQRYKEGSVPQKNGESTYLEVQDTSDTWIWFQGEKNLYKWVRCP